MDPLTLRPHPLQVLVKIPESLALRLPWSFWMHLYKKVMTVLVIGDVFVRMERLKSTVQIEYENCIDHLQVQVYA